MEQDAVLLLGARVAAAFGVEQTWPRYRWLLLRRGPCEPGRRAPLVALDRDVVRAAVLPHPSGRSRWWNDAGAVEELEAFVAKELP
jgi:hypothetical protein